MYGKVLVFTTHVSSVDGWGPPQCETTIWDLVQTGTLRIGKLLVLHRLLKSTGFLPEETLPGGEVGPLEKGVLKNTFNTT